MLFDDLATAGSAPRDDASELFQPNVWDRMTNHYADLLIELGAKTLVGFCQAGSDLLANWAYANGLVETLVCYGVGIPDLEDGKWKVANEAGKIVSKKRHVDMTNTCYKQFKETSGVDGFELLRACVDRVNGRFEYRYYWDFFRRNEVGVQNARVLVAYSKYENEELFLKNKGGTQFTWRKHQVSGNGYQIFVSIPGLMEA